MEESVKAMDSLREAEISAGDPKLLSPLTLAYLGDAVYELLLRTRVVAEGDTSAKRLTGKGISLARAGAQAALVEKILPELTKEEQILFRRGKNAKVTHVPQSASPQQYHLATAFEVLAGYWYLSGQTERMCALVKQGWEKQTDDGKTE